MSEIFGDMTLRSHVLIVKHFNLKMLVDWAILQGFTEFSVAKLDVGYQLSHPLAIDEREEYRWLYHKMKGLNGGPDDKPPTPPKGTPPSGGDFPTGGSSGSGVVAEYQDTIAVAA